MRLNNPSGIQKQPVDAEAVRKWRMRGGVKGDFTLMSEYRKGNGSKVSHVRDK